VSSSSHGTAVTYQRIPDEVAGTGPADIEARVAALVEFQRRYRVGESPLTLYRDAAAPNMLEAGGVLWQVDFSSCGQIRHQLDDLALLIETSTASPDEIEALYRAWWCKLEATPSSTVIAGLTEVGVRFADLLDAAYRNYEIALNDTDQTETWDRATARFGLVDISMLELRWADLAWFRSFRTARVRQKFGDQRLASSSKHEALT
jgi:hypothetical protein